MLIRVSLDMNFSDSQGCCWKAAEFAQTLLWLSHVELSGCDLA